MIAVADTSEVSKTAETPTGVRFDTDAIKVSSITPGPLGIADTSPIADAPAPIAMSASSWDEMQQIFTRTTNSVVLSGMTLGAGHSSMPDAFTCHRANTRKRRCVPTGTTSGLGISNSLMRHCVRAGKNCRQRSSFTKAKLPRITTNPAT